MKSFSILILLLLASQFSAQETTSAKTMGLYLTPSVQVGYNIRNQSDKKRHQESNNYWQNIGRPTYSNDFTYGFGLVGGYHLLPFFGIGAGIKYNFVANDIHTLNWVVQPKFFLGREEDKFTIELEYGKQFNATNLNNTSFFG